MPQTKIRSEQFQKEMLYDIQTALGPLPEVTDVTTVADAAGSLDGTYFTLDAPAGAFYVWYDAASPEVSTITTLAASTLTATGAGDYFTINSPTPTNYYVWYNVDAGNTDPAPGGTGIIVAVLSTDTDAQVATKTAAAIDLNGDFNAPVPGAAIVTVTNAADGSVTDAVDVNTGFTIEVTIQGIDASTDPTPGGTGLKVDINSGDTADTVASNTQTIVDGNGNFGASVSTNVVTITNATDGPVTDATVGTSGFTILVTQQGIDGDIYVVGFNFSTPTAGSATLLVFVDGVKKIEGVLNNYVSTAPTGVVFDSGSIPTAGQLVEFYGIG